MLTQVYYFVDLKSFLLQKLQKKYEMNKEAFVTLNAMLEDELENKSTDLAKIGGLWLMRQEGSNYHFLW